MMIIRKGTRADITKISRLWVRMCNELSPENVPNVAWWRITANKMASGDMYHFFVCEEGGRIRGFLDFFIYPEPLTNKWHMVGQHFYMEPEIRGNCVSGKLYRESIKFAKSKGATVAELFCFENEKTMWMKKGYKPVRSLVRRDI